MARDIGNGQYAENEIDTSTLFFDGTVTATTSAVVLGPEQKCIEVFIQAEPTNSAGMRVGTATSQSMYLAADRILVVPVTDVSKVYVKAISGTQRANFWARGG